MQDESRPPEPTPPEVVKNYASQESLLQRLAALEAQETREKSLPHIYGWPWYQWAWDFYTSTNRMCILVAANQLSKSSTQIRKCIEWATNKGLWATLWPNRTPRQFWYLYPTKDVCTSEFHTKWKPEFLPRVPENGPVYGWKAEFDNKKLKAIWFTSGIVLYFKTYETDVQALQTSTCDAIFTDEELPEHLYSELRARLMASNGYFSMVFTATLGQDLWYRTVERIGEEDEAFPTAFKRQVSMYDSLVYMDGSLSPWTKERIELEASFCKSEAERLRRIYGRFIRSDDILVPQFMQTNHVTHNPHGPPGTIPHSWILYSAVDIGSGYGAGHPAAIIFIAVSPARTKARVVRCWRGDGLITTCGDILDKYLAMEAEVSAIAPIAARVFDQASSEFFLISQSRNVFFDKSDKDRKSGFLLLNTLFKYNVLEMDKDLQDVSKLVAELRVVADDSGEEVLDDLLSTLRYCCKKIPFDFAKISETLLPPSPARNPTNIPIITPEQVRLAFAKKLKEDEIRDRRGDFDDAEGNRDPMDEELDFWQELS